MTEVDQKYISKELKKENVRWLTDAYNDLFLWYDERHLVRFQFAFGKNTMSEQLIEWNRESGIREYTIDDGEQTINSRFKSTPVFSTETTSSKDYITAFSKLASKIDSELYEEIFSYLSE